MNSPTVSDICQNLPVLINAWFLVTEQGLKSPFATNPIPIPIEPMRIWLIHSKSAVRNITAISICRIGRNAKIRVRAITWLHLSLSSGRLSIFLFSPETPRLHGLRLIPKAQLLTFGISLNLPGEIGLWYSHTPEDIACKPQLAPLALLSGSQSDCSQIWGKSSQGAFCRHASSENHTQTMFQKKIDFHLKRADLTGQLRYLYSYHLNPSNF